MGGVITDVTHFKDLEMRLCWVLRKGPKYNNECPYKKEDEGDVTPHTEDEATSQELSEAWEGGRGKEGTVP